MRVLTVCGSIQAHSSNRELLDAIEVVLSSRHDVEQAHLIQELPFFDLDLDGEALPQRAADWREQVARADRIIIASPEYGHSLPGVLKNAIDWLIPSGELYGKSAAITCSVNHQERGRMGLSALKQTLLAVDVKLVFSEPILRQDESQGIQSLLASLDLV